MLNWFINRQTKIVENIDPNRIKVSDISKFCLIPKFLAKFLLTISNDIQKNEDDNTYTLLK